MTNAVTTLSNDSPDWATHITDVLCPLCEYNLRGLTESRCPECGFAFTWREILDAEKNRHRYLFEHGRGRNIKTFWKTYWRTCRPTRFWTELNPAQPVHIVRMVIYLVIASGLMWAVLPGSRITKIIERGTNNLKFRYQYSRSCTQAELDDIFPAPWQAGFWQREYFHRNFRNGSYLDEYDYHPAGIGWFAIFFAWPWLTLASLLIFRRSMRKAKIRTVHLVRSAIYSCDFGLLFSLVVAGLFCGWHGVADGWLLLAAALVCSLVATYRLTVAFSRYLRVHRPLATVLASQVIAFLVVFVCLVWVADFGRHVALVRIADF